MDYRGIGSLEVVYGGPLSVCCIAHIFLVYVVYPHTNEKLFWKKK
jgi:hypothetical protein